MDDWGELHDIVDIDDKIAGNKSKDFVQREILHDGVDRAVLPTQHGLKSQFTSPGAVFQPFEADTLTSDFFCAKPALRTPVVRESLHPKPLESRNRSECATTSVDLFFGSGIECTASEGSLQLAEELDVDAKPLASRAQAHARRQQLSDELVHDSSLGATSMQEDTDEDDDLTDRAEAAMWGEGGLSAGHHFPSVDDAAMTRGFSSISAEAQDALVLSRRIGELSPTAGPLHQAIFRPAAAFFANDGRDQPEWSLPLDSDVLESNTTQRNDCHSRPLVGAESQRTTTHGQHGGAAQQLHQAGVHRPSREVIGSSSGHRNHVGMDLFELEPQADTELQHNDEDIDRIVMEQQLRKQERQDRSGSGRPSMIRAPGPLHPYAQASEQAAAANVGSLLIPLQSLSIRGNLSPLGTPRHGTTGFGQVREANPQQDGSIKPQQNGCNRKHAHLRSTAASGASQSPYTPGQQSVLDPSPGQWKKPSGLIQSPSFCAPESIRNGASARQVQRMDAVTAVSGRARNDAEEDAHPAAPTLHQMLQKMPGASSSPRPSINPPNMRRKQAAGRYAERGSCEARDASNVAGIAIDPVDSLLENTIGTRSHRSGTRSGISTAEASGQKRGIRKCPKYTRESFDRPKINVHPDVPHDYLSDDRLLKGSGRLHPQQICTLKYWMAEHAHWEKPYPTEAEKHDLSTKCELKLTQVSDWFRNERKRLWLPLMRRLGKVPPNKSHLAVLGPARRSKLAAAATAVPNTQRSTPRPTAESVHPAAGKESFESATPLDLSASAPRRSQRSRTKSDALPSASGKPSTAAAMEAAAKWVQAGCSAITRPRAASVSVFGGAAACTGMGMGMGMGKGPPRQHAGLPPLPPQSELLYGTVPGHGHDASSSWTASTQPGTGGLTSPQYANHPMNAAIPPSLLGSSTEAAPASAAGSKSATAGKTANSPILARVNAFVPAPASAHGHSASTDTNLNGGHLPLTSVPSAIPAAVQPQAVPSPSPSPSVSVSVSVTGAPPPIHRPTFGSRSNGSAEGSQGQHQGLASLLDASLGATVSSSPVVLVSSYQEGPRNARASATAPQDHAAHRLSDVQSSTQLRPQASSSAAPGLAVGAAPGASGATQGASQASTYAGIGSYSTVSDRSNPQQDSGSSTPVGRTSSSDCGMLSHGTTAHATFAGGSPSSGDESQPESAVEYHAPGQSSPNARGAPASGSRGSKRSRQSSLIEQQPEGPITPDVLAPPRRGKRSRTASSVAAGDS